MPTLGREPPYPLRSTGALFAIADAMEREAAARYAELAEHVRAAAPALATVFERLAAEERAHVECVNRWSVREQGHEPDPAAVPWPLPETLDDEDAGTKAPGLMTAYSALAMAVRNEERAFAFWAHVAAQAENPEVQRAAEKMASTELEHVAVLRRERRRAYHAALGSGGAADVGTAEMEFHLARLLKRRADATTSASEAARLRRLAEAARLHAEELSRDPSAVPAGTAGSLPDDPVVLAELLVDRYLETAESIRDGAALVRAQSLAGEAISRLAWLRSDLGRVVE